jgi:hypothetical protein
VLEDVEVKLGLEDVEPLGGHLLEPCLGVRKVPSDVLGLSDDTDDPSPASTCCSVTGCRSSIVPSGTMSL